DQNKLRHNPCHFVDVLPTLVELAGGEATIPGAPPRPGRSLAKVFQKDGTAPHDYLYFNHNNNRAIRVADMKLIATGEQGPWELYDLGKDRSEQHNLAGSQTDLAKTLAAQWKNHDEEYTRTRENSTATSKRQMVLRAER